MARGSRPVHDRVLVPQPGIETSATPVAWSLSCEAFFYLCFPLLFWLIRKIRPERLWYWATATAGLVWCVPLIGKVILPSTPVAPWAPSVSTYEFWFVYVFPPTRMLEFILGMLMAESWQPASGSASGCL